MAETVVKSAAFLVAYAAFGRAVASGWSTPGGMRLAQACLIGVAELGLLGAIWDRVVEREITAFVFVLFNNAAHLALLAAVCTVKGAGAAVAVFALLMLGGELIKIRFLHSTGFTVRGYSTRLVIVVVSGYAALYAVLLAVAVAG